MFTRRWFAMVKRWRNTLSVKWSINWIKGWDRFWLVLSLSCLALAVHLTGLLIDPAGVKDIPGAVSLPEWRVHSAECQGDRPSPGSCLRIPVRFPLSDRDILALQALETQTYVLTVHQPPREALSALPEELLLIFPESIAQSMRSGSQRIEAPGQTYILRQRLSRLERTQIVLRSANQYIGPFYDPPALVRSQDAERVLSRFRLSVIQQAFFDVTWTLIAVGMAFFLLFNVDNLMARYATIYFTLNAVKFAAGTILAGRSFPSFAAYDLHTLLWVEGVCGFLALYALARYVFQYFRLHGHSILLAMAGFVVSSAILAIYFRQDVMGAAQDWVEALNRTLLVTTDLSTGFVISMALVAGAWTAVPERRLSWGLYLALALPLSLYGLANLASGVSMISIEYVPWLSSLPWYEHTRLPAFILSILIRQGLEAQIQKQEKASLTDRLEGVEQEIAVQRQQKEELLSRLTLGESVQHLLFPPAGRVETPHLRLDLLHKSAGPMSGDWYWHHYDEREGRTIAFIGDVVGKGPAAALAVSVIQSTLNAWRDQPLAKGGSIQKVHEALLRDFGGEMTTALACVEVSQDSVDFYVCALSGWLICDAEGKVRFIQPKGRLIGDQKSSQQPIESTRFKPGEILSGVAFTDGVIEGSRQIKRSMRPLNEERMRNFDAQKYFEHFQSYQKAPWADDKTLIVAKLAFGDSVS